ncbi:MAG: LPS-assembly protein LptD [Treponema sp.]|nr:LPS-assembly protein LptD [Treponema sp.]
MNSKYQGLWVCILFLFALSAAYTQEESSDVDVKVLTPEQHRVDMDIRTSSLSELAAWSRSLGLSEGGTSADLARRLRSHFNISDQAPQGDDKRKIITIESARSSEYFKIEAVNEDYARLSGEVKLSLKDGDAIHRIQAWDILFNRSRNIITASGGVVYVKEEGDKIETFRGDSITVNLDNWSSIFLDGVSERSLQGDSTTYLFAGTVISRDEEDVTVLSKASISNANNEESLWSLNASRVWLLPGSDFAIYNAVLKVGEIPVLYIPFFYFPADEVVFHPVIGYRTREGNFVQTTTYILGRPKASSTSESSLTKILGNSADMEKKREGLFLRSTGKKVVNTNETSLRAMVDYYANLGAFLGADLDIPAKKLFGATSLSLGIGLTRTVVNDGGNYTPYFPDYDGSTDWNKSNLFSMEAPFRYRFRGSSSISGKYGSFSWSVPFYSDPLVDSDFLNRAESMDWINMIQKGAALDEEITAQNMMGSYSWQFVTQLNPKFPNMAPYISNISISSITNTIEFRTEDAYKNKTPNHNDIKFHSPSKYFYAPGTATLYSLSGSITGVPMSIGGTTTTVSQPRPVTTTNAAANTAEPAPNPLLNIGVPRSPFESEEPETVENTQTGDPTDKLVPPPLVQNFDLPRVGNTRLWMDYRLAPSAASTLKFDYEKWENYADIDWSQISSILSSVSGDAELKLNVKHSENFFSNTFSYTGRGTWREYSYLNEEAEEFLKTDGSKETDPEKVANARRQEYRNSSFTTSYNVTSSLQPLFRNPVFGTSSLQYGLRGLAVESKFKDTATADDPEWELIWGEWDKQKITAHNFTGNISALIMDKTQRISVTSELPPRDPALAWSASFRVWITETDGSMRIQYPGEPEKRKLEPFNLTERLNFGTFGSFTQTMQLDTELVEITTLTSTLNLSKWGLSASYAASRMLGEEYIPPNASLPINETGWRPRANTDENMKLRPRDFKVNYAKNFQARDLWDNRMQLTVNTSSQIFFNLQRYTSSNLTFNFGFTMGINKFLDLSLSATSENAFIYRYFKDMSPFNTADIDIPPGPQNNFFLDLFNSFRFDDEELRKSSGFKMKSFNVRATHYLGDWNAIVSWSMSPYRPRDSREIEISNEVSFLMQWIPISEIKSDISYNKRNTPEWMIKQ